MRPPTATLHHRVGRGLSKGIEPPGTLRGRDGVAIVSPQARQRHLMDSRRDLWESTPALPHSARPLLAAYGRRPLPHALPYPDTPVPPLSLIAGVILRAGGSAPGMDSTPYEAYHAGAHFVATLLSQAFYLLGQGLAGECEWVLGSNVDLLCWIPKTPGAAQADDLRPLQLPTCLRRLFGAIAEYAGASLESRLSASQAAIRGGSCGPNICRVVRHIEGTPARVPAPPRDAGLWDDLLGPLAGASDVICAAHPEGPLMAGRAAHIADQSKAFERLGLEWLRLVLETEQVPVWLADGLLLQVVGRRVAPPLGLAALRRPCRWDAASGWVVRRASSSGTQRTTPSSSPRRPPLALPVPPTWTTPPAWSAPRARLCAP